MTDSPSTRHELARILGAVARDLEAEQGEQATLAGIVRSAVDTVPGVGYGGISQVSGRRVTAQEPTDALVRECDEAQTELAEGPCLDAIWQQHTVIVDDMTRETRWPRFAARAAELGAGSLISFQLYVHDDTLGALNLYGETGARFGDEARFIGEVFASHAAVALSGARSYRQMNEALASRDAIGQAKGNPDAARQRHRPAGLRSAGARVATRQHQTRRRRTLAHRRSRAARGDRPPSHPLTRRSTTRSGLRFREALKSAQPGPRRPSFSKRPHLTLGAQDRPGNRLRRSWPLSCFRALSGAEP